MAYCSNPMCYDSVCIWWNVGPPIPKNKEFYIAAGRINDYYGLRQERKREAESFMNELKKYTKRRKGALK